MKHMLLYTFFVFLQVAEAGTIGDFAPLEIGNEWVYETESRETNSGFYSNISSGVRTVTILNSIKTDDTIWYYLSSHVQNATDSIQNGVVLSSRSVDNLYYDTLFEVAGIIKSTKFYLGAFPVRVVHEVDTSMAGIDSVYFVDGAWEFTSRSNGGLLHVISPTSQFTTYRFRAGFGVINSTSSGGVHMHLFSSETTLRSFNGITIGPTSVLTIKKRVVTINKDKCVSRVQLPYVKVTSKGRTFNLLGKVQQSTVSRNKPHSRKWNHQLYDLFR